MKTVQEMRELGKILAVALALMVIGCATPKPQTYEQILRSMPPDERERVEAEVADIEAYILENASRQESPVKSTQLPK